MQEKIDELYNEWRKTPEGMQLDQILNKLDRNCSNWMTGGTKDSISWFSMKKKLFVQIMQWYQHTAIGEVLDEAEVWTPVTSLDL
jgi:hypothetical protein